MRIYIATNQPWQKIAHFNHIFYDIVEQPYANFFSVWVFFLQSPDSMGKVVNMPNIYIECTNETKKINLQEDKKKREQVEREIRLM